MVTGKGDFSSFSGDIPASPSSSEQLGEENKRRKLRGTPTKPAGRQYKSREEANDGQRVGHFDDDSSIIAQPSRTPSCGACRTRESKIWWKAPKGLSTNILCDICGTNWRKYADLNVRPVLVTLTMIRPSSRNRLGPQVVVHAVLENRKFGGRHPKVYPQIFYATFVEQTGASTRT